MPYVMVPVPEEHVEEVMTFVLRAVARASIEDWDADSMTQFFNDVDEPSRALMSVVARATLAGKELSEPETADMIELSRRETLGILRELNDLARDITPPRPMVLIQRTVTDTLPNGHTRERRVLAMAEEVAQLVQEAERKELMSEPHPLSGTE